MSNMTWEAVVNSGQYNQLNAGTAYASSITITDISPGGNTAAQAFTFQAGSLQVGMRFRLRAAGVVSTTATPNLTLGVYYGGVAGVALASTGAVATGSGLSSQIWRLDADFQVVTVGATGSIITVGSVNGPYSALLPAAGTSPTVTVDTTANKILTVGATWGTSSASNTITQSFPLLVELLN